MQRGPAGKGGRLVNNGSRFGMRGTEDLGGGLTAGFNIEHGFNANDGTTTGGNTFWNRQSEVWLKSAEFGTVRLGRSFSDAYFATADYISMHNHDTGTSSDALYAYVVNNANKGAYRSPEFNGFTLEVGGTLATGQPNKTYDAALSYNAGPLGLGFGYGKNGTANQATLRASYAVDSWVFGAYLQRDENGVAANGGNRTNLRLAAMYVDGKGEYHLNFGRAGAYSKIANSAATQYTLGYNYNLSKRTKIYTFYTAINDGSAKVYGDDFRSLAVGIRHNF